MAGGPLEGVRVLDFSRVLAGPHCGRMLVDLGADVIKVEPPEGDLTRFGQPRIGSLSVYFIQQNCGKRNISLDMSRPEAASLLLDLAPHVDVVLENFRPTVMDRMGLGWAEWQARNPKIVYAAISGYGQSGPWRDRRAYARVVHAEAGIMVTDARSKAKEPEHDTFSHADVYTALECLAAINAALFQRSRTGEGQRIDVAMAETMLTVNEHAAIDISGLPLDRPGGKGIPMLGRGTNPVFPAPGGGWVTIASDPCAAGAFPHWCKAIGRDDLVEDPRFAEIETRVANREALVGEIRAWIEVQPSVAAIEAAFATQRMPIGVLRDVDELAATDWADDRGAIVEVDDREGGTVRIPNSPWRFSGAPTGVRGQPAFRGEHNRQVFQELLGLSEADLDKLEGDGVLSSRGPAAVN